jgi:hypothetical protein
LHGVQVRSGGCLKLTDALGCDAFLHVRPEPI